MTAVATPLVEKSQEHEVEQAADPCLSTAELAECTCPDFCERDHEND
jgi:hypothetical protein